MYPKNGTSSITKTNNEQTEFGLGSIVSFPVTTEVPAVRPGGSLLNYVISDALDERLAPAGIASISVGGATVLPTYYSVDTTGQAISVTFTPADLDWLKTQAQEQIVTTFQGTVTTLDTDIDTDTDTDADNGAISNKAVVLVNGHELTSNEVTTNWGDVRILKTDVSTPAVGLAGAEFEVYASSDLYAETCGIGYEPDIPLTVGGANLFTSTDAGLVYIPGLFVSDSVNPNINATQRCYVLMETKAPAGFITPTGDAALTAVAVQIGATAVGTYDGQPITNTQQDVPDLPLTGANVQLIMIAGGSAVLLISVGLVLVNRRRTSTSDKV